MKNLVTIEIAAFQKYKYEMKNGMLVLDRPLNQTIPANYGYFNNTLEDDKDPLDCFVITQSPLTNGIQCKVNIIGAFVCLDAETRDDKVICSLEGELIKSLTKEIEDIKHYLETYKQGFKVLEFVGKEDAEKILANSSKVFLDNVDKLKEELMRPVRKFTKTYDDCE